VRGKFTGLLLLTLSLGISLNLTASFQTICSVTFEECSEVVGHEDCCAVGCCHEGDEQDCCFVISENGSDFLTPSSLPTIEAPFLADVPFESDWFCSVSASEISFLSDRFPDPPPRSGRDLLSLIERCLI
jgi:hypothetical protein